MIICFGKTSTGNSTATNVYLPLTYTTIIICVASAESSGVQHDTGIKAKSLSQLQLNGFYSEGYKHWIAIGY